jgi:hypothetical protein
MQLDPGLVPITHYSGEGYRVPVWVSIERTVSVSVDEKIYTVCIGSTAYRYYTEDTVPKEIKGLIAMVRAFPVSVRMALDYDGTPAKGMLRYTPPDPRLEEIGWQLNDNTYMLVLGCDLLASMYITGDGHG